jgi:hypothetical protein
MEEALSSETFVRKYRTTRRRIPGDNNLKYHLSRNQKSHIKRNYGHCKKIVGTVGLITNKCTYILYLHFPHRQSKPIILKLNCSLLSSLSNVKCVVIVHVFYRKPRLVKANLWSALSQGGASYLICPRKYLYLTHPRTECRNTMGSYPALYAEGPAFTSQPWKLTEFFRLFAQKIRSQCLELGHDLFLLLSNQLFTDHSNIRRHVAKATASLNNS